MPVQQHVGPLAAPGGTQPIGVLQQPAAHMPGTTLGQHHVERIDARARSAQCVVAPRCEQVVGLGAPLGSGAGEIVLFVRVGGKVEQQLLGQAVEPVVVCAQVQPVA